MYIGNKISAYNLKLIKRKRINGILLDATFFPPDQNL